MQPVAPAGPLTVAAAVSLTDVLEEIAKAYAAAGGGPVRFNLAGSNVLARQIRNGAPADVFISADEAQMEIVEKAGAVLAGSRVDLVGKPAGGCGDAGSCGFRAPGICARSGWDSPTGHRRSGSRAGRRLRPALPRAAGPVDRVRATSRADDERQGRADGGRNWERRRRDRVPDRSGRGAHARFWRLPCRPRMGRASCTLAPCWRRHATRRKRSGFWRFCASPRRRPSSRGTSSSCRRQSEIVRPCRLSVRRYRGSRQSSTSE